MKNINELEKEFDELEKSDSLIYIRFYEKNKESIDNIDITKDEKHYNTKLRLLSEFGLSLVSSGQYTKGVEILEQAISMFENDTNQDFEKLNEIPYFEHLLWHYARTLFEIKQVNKSIEVFTRLVNYYPNNEKYKKWLVGLKANKITKFRTPLLIICFVWIIIEIMFYNSFNAPFKLIYSFLGVLILLTLILFELYVYLKKRKKFKS
ncbi:MAG: tetratricopeptide repeat protein [Saprospiraceae bacterium]|nr:tetratricopeptide repeat protein [Saprospiraceae bacterium]